MPNEVDKFFDELGKPPELEDAFSQAIANDNKPSTDDTTDKDETPEKDTTEEPRKNRRHRRWEEQLAKRERDIAMKEAVLAAQESKTPVDSSEVPLEWTALYGDTPEAKRAWEIQSKREQILFERAKTEAIKEFQSIQANAEKEQKQFEDFVVSQLEDLEDEFSIDLTSNSPAAKKTRKELLEIVQKLSPKNEQGAITAYADFSAAYEMYASTKEKANNARAKDLSDRTMTTSQKTENSPTKRTAGFNGWRTDLNL